LITGAAALGAGLDPLPRLTPLAASVVRKWNTSQSKPFFRHFRKMQRTIDKNPCGQITAAISRHILDRIVSSKSVIQKYAEDEYKQLQPIAAEFGAAGKRIVETLTLLRSLTHFSNQIWIFVELFEHPDIRKVKSSVENGTFDPLSLDEGPDPMSLMFLLEDLAEAWDQLAIQYVTLARCADDFSVDPKPFYTASEYATRAGTR
jgi:hypothetical protein